MSGETVKQRFPAKFPKKKTPTRPAHHCSLPSIPTCIALKYSCGVALHTETKIKSPPFFFPKFSGGEKNGLVPNFGQKQIGKKKCFLATFDWGKQSSLSMFGILKMFPPKSHWIHWVNRRIGIGGNLKAYLGGSPQEKSHAKLNRNLPFMGHKPRKIVIFLQSEQGNICLFQEGFRN